MDGKGVRVMTYCQCSHCKQRRDDLVSELRDAGFGLAYVHPVDAEVGYVVPREMTDEYYGGHRSHHITGEAHDYYGEPFVDFGDVASGEDSYGQTSTVARSNMVALQRDFPEFPWVEVAYSYARVLGCFVRDLTDDMAHLMIGLAVEYPVYDENTMSEIEYEEVEQSWSGWLSREIWRELSEPARTMWDALGDDTVSELWWACVSWDVVGYEHTGTEVSWGRLDKVVEAFRPVVIGAYWTQRKGIEINDAYLFVRLVKGY